MKQPHLDQDTLEELETNQIKIRPELRKEGYYGLLGTAALCLCDGSIAIPELVTLSLLARTAASIKKGNVVVKNGSQRTELRINGLIAMRTGGGKGVGESCAQLLIDKSKVYSESSKVPVPLFARVHEGGLSTTEGIVNELRDDCTGKNGEVIHGVSDKRLCIIEEEFANIFIKCRSNNSNLSSTIRKLFDGTNLSPLTKHDRISCTNPHVCIIGHITPKEFLAEVTGKDLYNGFSNRFLTILGFPKAVIPFPKPLNEEIIDALSIELADAIKWCNNTPRTLEMADSFKDLWVVEVHRISELGAPDSTEATLMVRAAHYAIIISGVFAALDKTCTLTDKHLHAALAWIDYWHESIRYVFDTEAEAHANQVRIKNAEEVLSAIKQVTLEVGSRSFKRTYLSKKLSRKVPTEVANIALQDLQERPVPPIAISRTGSKNCQIITLL
ncbi:DUF3987 domain-containing protein [Vibrio coralliirubri]|uniref:DUF3987 domain-containing protein n=1 Tax=Vibrio coralliirubri TaxID=1516159 RepID=UPI000B34F81C|nr:DUF3987 domain-containing protein [Vibrio coralliirubri]